MRGAGIAPHVLRLGARWVVSFTSQSLCPPRERARGTHLIWVWIGPRAGVDAAAKRKNPCSCLELNTGRTAQSLQWLSYPGTI